MINLTRRWFISLLGLAPVAALVKPEPIRPRYVHRNGDQWYTAEMTHNGKVVWNELHDRVPNDAQRKVMLARAEDTARRHGWPKGGVFQLQESYGPLFAGTAKVSPVTITVS